MTVIACNGAELFCEVAGEGPPLLLINGLGCDTRTWQPLLPLLVASRRAIAFDARGAGRNEKPAGPYSIRQFADDAIALIEALCDGPVHLLGFSMGGCVALDLAARRPEIVTTLALVSAFPAWNGPFPHPPEVQALFRRTDVSQALLTEVFERIFGSNYKRRISAEDYIAFRMHDDYPQPAHAYLAQLAALEAADTRAASARISCPTRIIAGADDRIVPPANARWLHERIAGSILTFLEGVGHMVPVEAPRELAACLRDACASLPPA